MKSTAKPTGKEFVSEVSASVGEELRFGKWVERLYDLLESRREIRLFKELAFEAKTAQRLRRVKSSGISDDVAKQKVQLEIGSALKRFSQLLERASIGFDNDARIQFRKLFLEPAAFENTLDLVADFSMVKDFYLKKRDAREEI